MFLNWSWQSLQLSTLPDPADVFRCTNLRKKSIPEPDTVLVTVEIISTVSDFVEIATLKLNQGSYLKCPIKIQKTFYHQYSSQRGRIFKTNNKQGNNEKSEHFFTMRRVNIFFKSLNMRWEDIFVYLFLCFVNPIPFLTV